VMSTSGLVSRRKQNHPGNHLWSREQFAETDVTGVNSRRF
jgi:hypothetical protein